MPGDLAEDLVPSEERHHEQLRRQAALRALDRVPGRATSPALRRTELDRPHQPHAADVAHDLVAIDERRREREQELAQLGSTPDEPLTLDHPQRREPRSGGEVVAAEGRSMADATFHAVEHAVAHGCRDEHAANRDEAAGEGLGNADHVRIETPVLEREEAPGPSQARLHLIADEQRVVLATRCLGGGEVALRRDVHALSLNRLDDERGDVLARELGPQRVAIAERHGLASRDERPEPLAEVLVAVEGQRAEGEAVKGVLGVEDAGSPGRRSRELDRALDGLGAGVRRSTFA